MESETEAVGKPEPLYVHVTDIVKGEDKCERAVSLKLAGVKGTNAKVWETTFGTIFHKTMERWIKNKGDMQESDFIAILTEFKDKIPTNNPDVLAGEIVRLKEMIAEEGAALQPLIDEGCTFETEFNIQRKIDGTVKDRPVIVTGTIDLIVTDKDGLGTVIDYKTGKKVSKEHLEQVGIYTELLRQSGRKMGKPLVHAGGTGKVVIKQGTLLDEGELETLTSDYYTFLQKVNGTDGSCKVGYMCRFCEYSGSNCWGL